MWSAKRAPVWAILLVIAVLSMAMDSPYRLRAIRSFMISLVPP